MIPEEDLARWAGLYDLGHRNLDGWSDPRAAAARERCEQNLWLTWFEWPSLSGKNVSRIKGPSPGPKSSRIRFLEC
jgi:hypothetical protein